jgi:hypothetical protein
MTDAAGELVPGIFVQLVLVRLLLNYRPELAAVSHHACCIARIVCCRPGAQSLMMLFEGAGALTRDSDRTGHPLTASAAAGSLFLFRAGHVQGA